MTLIRTLAKRRWKNDAGDTTACDIDPHAGESDMTTGGIDPHSGERDTTVSDIGMVSASGPHAQRRNHVGKTHVSAPVSRDLLWPPFQMHQHAFLASPPFPSSLPPRSLLPSWTEKEGQSLCPSFSLPPIPLRFCPRSLLPSLLLSLPLPPSSLPPHPSLSIPLSRCEQLEAHFPRPIPFDLL